MIDLFKGMTREERREAIEYLKKYRELDKQLYQTAPFTSVSHSALVKCLRYWEIAIQALEQEPETDEPNTCDFCSMIYPDNDTLNIFFRRGKYSDIHVDSMITIDDEGKYHVNIDPGDPYELGYLVDIKFCPYCGRKLPESEG